jgi:peptidoglycan/xylan/chitin deacetylase (PgdA/CDA1 family)
VDTDGIEIERMHLARLLSKPILPLGNFAGVGKVSPSPQTNFLMCQAPLLSKMLRKLGLCVLAFWASAELPAETAPQSLSTDSQVTILGYHRFENPAKDSLAISTAAFREQMQALKDGGMTVISMADFLAWRRGEKAIPERSVLITIDDGYNCTYSEAWPVLKEFGYPFTFYVYGNYISAGGRSITWAQLEEMRDAGVDIGSHSISHDNMVRPKRAKGQDYETWLSHELKGSKELLESRLGIPIRTFAYPFGVNNARVQEVGLAVGYEALFTVAGKKIGRDAPAAAIGRYVIQSDKPEVFRLATNFGAARGVVATATAPGIPVQPAHGSTLAAEPAKLEVDFSGVGKVDPKSVTLRISGLGVVVPEFDPVSNLLSYPLHERLHHRDVQVVASARVDGRKMDVAWQFRLDPSITAATAPSEEALTPPDAAAQPDTAPSPAG